MTRTEILELVQQAGLYEWWDSDDDDISVFLDRLESFAKLVAAKEKEACAQVFDADKFPDASTDYRIWYNEQMEMNAEKIRSRT